MIGASLTVETPTGQYDGARLINIGEHDGRSSRSSDSPVVGDIGWSMGMCQRGSTRRTTISFRMHRARRGQTGRRRSRWELSRLHLSYDVKPRLWVSVDGNYWYGGKTSLNGVETPTTLQANSRLGGNGSDSDHEASVAEVQLQPRNLRNVRRQLPKRVSRMAVLVDGPSELTCRAGFRGAQALERWLRPVRRHREPVAPCTR